MANEEMDIVRKLWNLCHVLRDDGISYQNYVTELTFVLFPKMLSELEREGELPAEFRWKGLAKRDGVELLDHYRLMLLELGKSKNKRVAAIYRNASTSIRQPKHLYKIVQSIDELDWHSETRDHFGDLYEGLLEKNAGETKSGAGQYFTPRRLIDCMVRVMKPRPGENIQDPAAGTGGFLIAADRYIKSQTDELFTLKETEQEFQRKQAFYGCELVEDTHRLLLMNLMLHGIEGNVDCESTLSPYGANLKPANLILTNPPFGTAEGGGRPTRDDFTFLTGNKQLNFLQHIYRNLAVSGRAAVVLPDNVLFEEGRGIEIRKDLIEKCNLHTILRLPTGIFYAQGVKTNVLFFSKSEKTEENTKEIWVYDLRSNMPSFGKTTPLKDEHFKDFETCFGDDPHGQATRLDLGPEGRFRKFGRESIEKRGYNLDIRWLRDESAENYGELPDPDQLILEARAEIQEIVSGLNAILLELSSCTVDEKTNA